MLCCKWRKVKVGSYGMLQLSYLKVPIGQIVFAMAPGQPDLAFHLSSLLYLFYSTISSMFPS